MIEDGKHLIWSWTRVNQAYCKIIRRLSHKPAGGRWRKVVQCDNGRWPQIPRRDITATSICWVAASRVYLHSASFLVQVTQKWKWIWVCRRFDRLTYVSAQSENKIKTPRSEKQVQETFFRSESVGLIRLRVRSTRFSSRQLNQSRESHHDRSTIW